MRFSIENFGCRVNQAEVFSWVEILQEKGFEWAKDSSQSNIVIVNTCTLTSKADQEARKLIRKIYRENPEIKIVLTGCYADRSFEQFQLMPEVWALFKNSEKEQIPSRIIQCLDYNLRNSKDHLKCVKSFRSRAFVKIQDGCNFLCTFCIIPSVRGKSRSKPLPGILNQIKKYITQGFKEIILTGIHLCSYGLDLTPRSSLFELLKRIEKLDGLNKIRLSSLDPRFLNSDFISYLSSNQKIAPHFHLSFQSGSNKLLERMGRHSTINQYRDILSTFFKLSPEASLGADIIVGFPGEIEEDFNQTYNFLESSPLTYFHIFPFSPRPGTPAFRFPQINGRIKKERARILRELSKKKNFEFRKKFVNKNLKGIITKKEQNSVQILTYNYLNIKANGNDKLKEGQEKEIKIIQVTPSETRGELISN
ncbi:MAG: tRNA (N(6)-L-threonylcarbamoyladenosine(37)-C(2))-methylthiotransferase MtaB [Candidatus Aminicenantia bacterium]